MKTGIKVADAMSVSPVTILSNKSVLDCARSMSKRKVGSVLIIKEEKLEGILTERDLVQFIAKGLDPKKTKIREVMTKKIHTIGPEADIYDALSYMKKEKIRRLPVLYKKKLVGMLTVNDILKLQPGLFDILVEKVPLPKGKKKEKYIEGNCEVCENFAQLYELDDKFICAECREEMGSQTEDDEE